MMDILTSCQTVATGVLSTARLLPRESLPAPPRSNDGRAAEKAVLVQSPSRMVATVRYTFYSVHPKHKVTSVSFTLCCETQKRKVPSVSFSLSSVHSERKVA